MSAPMLGPNRHVSVPACIRGCAWATGISARSTIAAAIAAPHSLDIFLSMCAVAASHARSAIQVLGFSPLRTSPLVQRASVGIEYIYADAAAGLPEADSLQPNQVT